MILVYYKSPVEKGLSLPKFKYTPWSLPKQSQGTGSYVEVLDPFGVEFCAGWQMRICFIFPHGVTQVVLDAPFAGYCLFFSSMQFLCLKKKGGCSCIYLWVGPQFHYICHFFSFYDSTILFILLWVYNNLKSGIVISLAIILLFKIVLIRLGLCVSI